MHAPPNKSEFSASGMLAALSQAHRGVSQLKISQWRMSDFPANPETGGKPTCHSVIRTVIQHHSSQAYAAVHGPVSLNASHAATLSGAQLAWSHPLLTYSFLLLLNDAAHMTATPKTEV